MWDLLVLRRKFHFFSSLICCELNLFLVNGEALGLNFFLPDKATKSSIDRPLWEKLFCSCDMLKDGDGNCIVSLALDILPSFLPLGTSQPGPPDCNNIAPT